MILSSLQFQKRVLGFTMIELLVVVTIMIVLTTIGLVSYRGATQNARNGKRATDIESVRSALVLYRADTGSYPATSDFSAMLSAIASYYSAATLNDPINEAPHVYTYSSDGVTFEICYTQEPYVDSSDEICLYNP